MGDGDDRLELVRGAVTGLFAAFWVVSAGVIGAAAGSMTSPWIGLASGVVFAAIGSAVLANALDASWRWRLLAVIALTFLTGMSTALSPITSADWRWPSAAAAAAGAAAFSGAALLRSRDDGGPRA